MVDVTTYDVDHPDSAFYTRLYRVVVDPIHDKIIDVITMGV